MALPEFGRSLPAMSSKIIAAYSEAPDAQDGISLAGALGTVTGGEVVVARVMQDLTTANAMDRPAQRLLRTRLDDTHTAAADALALAAPAEVFPLVDRSIPGALHELAHTLDAEFMTFGATHLGRLGRLLFGGGAESVVSGSPCTVAVAPHDFHQSGTWEPATIGVAYDASLEADAALEMARGLAVSAGATLRLIAVEPTWLQHRVRVGGPPSHGHELVELLDAAVERAGATVPTHRTLLSGDPAGTLANEAATLDALVMGSRGHGPLGRILLSSVSAELMRAPVCPLFVVPRRDDAPE